MLACGAAATELRLLVLWPAREASRGPQPRHETLAQGLSICLPRPCRCGRTAREPTCGAWRGFQDLLCSPTPVGYRILPRPKGPVSLVTQLVTTTPDFGRPSATPPYRRGALTCLPRLPQTKSLRMGCRRSATHLCQRHANWVGVDMAERPKHAPDPRSSHDEPYRTILESSSPTWRPGWGPVYVAFVVDIYSRHRWLERRDA